MYAIRSYYVAEIVALGVVEFEIEDLRAALLPGERTADHQGQVVAHGPHRFDAAEVVDHHLVVALEFGQHRFQQVLQVVIGRLVDYRGDEAEAPAERAAGAAHGEDVRCGGEVPGAELGTVVKAGVVTGQLVRTGQKQGLFHTFPLSATRGVRLRDLELLAGADHVVVITSYSIHYTKLYENRACCLSANCSAIWVIWSSS